MHCFTESLEVARAAIEMGFYISFSGIVTFKSAKDLQAVALEVPLERILIETDSPYLAPMPHRGKMNEPGFVAHVAEYIAKLKGIPVEQVAAQTTANFFKLFKLAAAITMANLSRRWVLLALAAALAVPAMAMAAEQTDDEVDFFRAAQLDNAVGGEKNPRARTESQCPRTGAGRDRADRRHALRSAEGRRTADGSTRHRPGSQGAQRQHGA
jgi:hypothetical protein